MGPANPCKKYDRWSLHWKGIKRLHAKGGMPTDAVQMKQSAKVTSALYLCKAKPHESSNSFLWFPVSDVSVHPIGLPYGIALRLQLGSRQWWWNTWVTPPEWPPPGYDLWLRLHGFCHPSLQPRSPGADCCSTKSAKKNPDQENVSANSNTNLAMSRTWNILNCRNDCVPTFGPGLLGSRPTSVPVGEPSMAIIRKFRVDAAGSMHSLPSPVAVHLGSSQNLICDHTKYHESLCISGCTTMTTTNKTSGNV